ncbi:MAG: serine--tRNA ligase [Myxococcales bacterium]|nr:serine--tRNA ligase [Myxococcales bacterium]MCB9669091.1 serine--tRNA ligase [Alphaproteobacteria bacterium]
MIDPRVLTEQPELVKAHLARRHDGEAASIVDAVVDLAARRKAIVGERDDLRAERNTLSKAIGGLYKSGKADEAEAMKARVAEGAERIKALEDELSTLEATIEGHALTLPNLLHDHVPDGRDEHDNVVVRTWGTPRTFDFEPQAHVEVGARLGILDFDRSTKLSGARFGILTGAAARMDRALVDFFLDTHTREHGYTEVSVPYIVQAQAAVGTGQLPKFAGDMFRLAEPLNGETAYLIPTAEVPVTNIHRDEILEEADLPVKYVAFSPCFRSEAGSAGRDVRGLIRQHQFHKVEMVWVVTPEAAEAAHAELVRNAEVLLQALELPYRTVELCAGDTSFGAHRCFDIEAWMPSQGTYREVSSCSVFGDFQARRMNLRYRPAPVDGKKQKPRFCWTLNGSGLPIGRIMVAILENYQQEDGSVVVPEVLRSRMGTDVLRPPQA